MTAARNAVVSFSAVYLLLAVGAQVYFLSLVPAFGWDSLQFWLLQSHFTLEGVESTEYHNGVWIHPQPRLLIEIISAFIGHGIPYQYLWFIVSLIFWLFAIKHATVVRRGLAPVLLLTGLLLSCPLWESHVLIVGYADLYIASFFGLALLLARSALTNGSLSALAGFLLVCSSLHLLKNTGSAYAVVLGLTYVQAKYITRWRCLHLFAIALIAIFIFLVPSSIKSFNLDIKFIYGGNSLEIMPYSGKEIFSNWWVALFKNNSFSIIPVLLLVTIFWIISQPRRPEQWMPFCAIINVFFMLTISQWFEYGFVHAAPGSDTGNSRFFLTIVSSIFFATVDQIHSSELSQGSASVSYAEYLRNPIKL